MCMHMGMHIFVHACTPGCIDARVHLCTYACTGTYMYMHGVSPSSVHSCADLRAHRHKHAHLRLAHACAYQQMHLAQVNAPVLQHKITAYHAHACVCSYESCSNNEATNENPHWHTTRAHTCGVRSPAHAHASSEADEHSTHAGTHTSACTMHK